MRPPLPLTRLHRIVAGYTINRLGTWFGYVALSIAVFDHTHSALAVAALLVVGQAIPAFLGPAVVARLEASVRRGGLSLLYLIETILTVALALLMSHFSLAAVLVLVAIDGTAALAASAILRAEAAKAARERLGAQAGAINDAQPHEEVQTAERKANASLNVAFSLTFVSGPVLAGVLVAGAGAATALLVDAASFLIAALMLIDLSPHADEAAAAGVRSRLREAWAHINEVATLRALLIVESISLVFFAADASIEVPYAKVTLHAGDRGYGLILTAWGVGTWVGSLAFARAVRRPVGSMLSGGALAVGIAYVGFAIAPTLALACMASFVGGLGNGTQWASLISAVQQLTPPRLHGRLMGAVEAMTALFPGMGLLLGGVLVALSSPRTAFLTVGLAAAAMTAAFIRVTAGSGLRSAGGREGIATPREGVS